MKIVCICQDETSVNCVTSGLLQDHEIPLLIIPDFDAIKPGATSSKKKRKRSKKGLLKKVISRIFFSVVSRKASASKIHHLIHQQCSESLELSKGCPNIVTIPTYAMNSESTAALIKQHEPDLLFVCGAPILKDLIFDIPKYGSVNFHYGYSPKYKGQHTLLWAFIKGDHENLGGTFLRIDKGVDTGTPISFVYPEVKKTDTLEDVEAKLAVLARSHASEAMEAACKISGSASGSAQRAPADFMVRFHDYGPIEHLSYYFRLVQNRFFQRSSILRKEQITKL